MNVTPLIDVLFVLIIIFLVITPKLPHGFKTAIPAAANQDQPQENDTIVVTVLAGGRVKLNQEPLPLEDLDRRLREVFRDANHVIFIRAEKDLDFRSVADVIDIARGAGLERVALMPN